MKKILFILIVILAFSLVSCTSPSDCNEKEVEPAIEEIWAVYDDYFDAQRLASITSRGSLSPLIETMMEIQDNAEDLEVPLCLEGAKTDLDNGISFGIEAFFDFLADSEGENIDSYLELSVDSFGYMTTELSRIEACMPNCEPDQSRYATKTPTARPTIATEYIGWAKVICSDCGNTVLTWKSYEGPNEVSAEVGNNHIVNVIATKFNDEENRYYYLIQDRKNKSAQGWIPEDFLTSINLDD